MKSIVTEVLVLVSAILHCQILLLVLTIVLTSIVNDTNFDEYNQNFLNTAGQFGPKYYLNFK